MANTKTPVQIATMPLRGADYWIVAVSSMEQIIGAGISTVVGIMIPMMLLTGDFHLSSLIQGLLGATGLVGIGAGSALIGRWSDKHGYLLWFRLCPLLILAGALICYFMPNLTILFIGLFICGFGVGGGYALDSDYISELMPDRWKLIMVGVAKATSSFGFLGVAVICFIILKLYPEPQLWNGMMLIIGAMGLLTFLMRIRWYQSPLWLRIHGLEAKAAEATKKFLGDDVEMPPMPAQQSAGNESNPKTEGSLMQRLGWARVIFSGLPWACEGLGVYGFGVFLPVLVMALGIDNAAETGIGKVISSIEVTAVVNTFILVGFVVGLLVFRKINHVKILSWGFIGSAIGLTLILVGYLYHLPVWIMVVGFVVFEFALNMGPHLITFIIPAMVFPVDVRSTGAGIAGFLGKVGAVIGVILMPLLLKLGGMTLVLGVSIAVMLLGCLISEVYGRILKLM